MNEFILALALIMGLDQVPEATRPQPTKEQEKLIELLGHSDWKTREGADKELVKLGLKAHVALERKGVTSDDPEIRDRAIRIHKSYYKFVSTKGTTPGVTGLFKLKQITLKNGKTITIEPGTAKRYLLAVAGGDIEHDIFQCYDPNEAGNEWMVREAVKRYAKHLYRMGFTPAEMAEILDAIEENQEKWKAFDLKQDEDTIEWSGQFESRGP